MEKGGAKALSAEGEQKPSLHSVAEGVGWGAIPNQKDLPQFTVGMGCNIRQRRYTYPKYSKPDMARMVS